MQREGMQRNGVKRNLGGWLALAAGLAASPCLAAAPLEAYGKLPSMEDVRISPDGTLLAVLVTDGDKRDIVIEQAADQKVVAAIRTGDQKVRDLRWAGSDHLLVTKTTTQHIPDWSGAIRAEYAMVIDFNLKTRTQLPLLGDGTASANIVLGQPQVRTVGGRVYAFVRGVQFTDYTVTLGLYRVDLDSGQTQIDLKPSEDAQQWLVNADGQPVVRSEYDSRAGEWRLEASRGGDWRVVETVPAKIETPELLGFGPDGRTALVRVPQGGQQVMREYPIGADDWGAPTPMPAGEDLIFDPVTDDLIGQAELRGDTLRYSFRSAADQATWNAALSAFPGEFVRLASMSADHRKLVVRADSPTEGPAYCLIDLDAKTAHWLGPVYNQLTPDDISPVQPVAFAAQDGLQLSGYLTLPKGKAAKDLPLIVFPHGGPAARDTPGFDWWAQAMASRGYAVLQVNYRGSDGFGWDFMSAGFGEWGRKMQTDLSDGVRYLAAQGTIDPKRVCIVGASYGGYAALAGATLDTGVYRCAVSIAGPSDLRRMVSVDTHEAGEVVERYWDRFMGAKSPDDPHLADISPARHVDRVTIPLMLIQGQDDTVVPFEQSRIMADAMRAAGKPVDFVVLKSEDHWLSRGETRLQMLQATMDFLQKNNPPG